jgi:hypothetical protein
MNHPLTHCFLCISEESGPPLTTREIRVATILRELPYTISFAERALIFQNLVVKHKSKFILLFAAAGSST